MKLSLAMLFPLLLLGAGCTVPSGQPAPEFQEEFAPVTYTYYTCTIQGIDSPAFISVEHNDYTNAEGFDAHGYVLPITHGYEPDIPWPVRIRNGYDAVIQSCEEIPLETYQDAAQNLRRRIKVLIATHPDTEEVLFYGLLSYWPRTTQESEHVVEQYFGPDGTSLYTKTSTAGMSRPQFVEVGQKPSGIRNMGYRILLSSEFPSWMQAYLD